ncbi:hypothetical protein MHK74_14600 [Microbacterium aurum]|uniref:hypothetical protein n=1 Tax=Microbacterium aurum TaxID=36805 RepID=UPI001EF6D6C2|nr:hypothetical protein [Microbacterium aurum]MCG7415770.1 hypothetical protein [Microbacterium aurum]
MPTERAALSTEDYESLLPLVTAERLARVIAELSRGFWRYLVESRYLTSLWVPSTHAAFAHGHVLILTHAVGGFDA